MFKCGPIQRCAVIASLALIVSGAAWSDSFIGQASVIDGDTLEIHETRSRLWGVDAPESNQLCLSFSSSASATPGVWKYS
jgi:endonuclease YncB( thermonuclease family)